MSSQDQNSEFSLGENENIITDAIIYGFSELNYAPNHDDTEQAYCVMIDVFKKLGIPLEKVVKKLVERKEKYMLDTICDQMYDKNEIRKYREKYEQDAKKREEDAKEYEKNRERAEMLLLEDDEFDVKQVFNHNPLYWQIKKVLEDRKNLQENMKNEILTKEIDCLFEKVIKNRDVEALQWIVHYLFVDPVEISDREKIIRSLTNHAHDIDNKECLDLVKNYIEIDPCVYACLGDIESLKKCNAENRWDHFANLAAKYGHYDLLRYIIEEMNTEISVVTYCNAIVSGNADILSYLETKIDSENRKNLDFYLAMHYIQTGDCERFLTLKNSKNLLDIYEEFTAGLPEVSDDPELEKKQTQMFLLLKSWIRKKYM